MDQDKKDPPAPKGDTNPPVTPPAPAVPVPPAPPAPAVPSPAPAPKTAAHIDLDKILLPKKEVPGQTVQSAERINAGALLEQEQLAGTEGIKAPEAPAQVPPQPTVPKKDDVFVKPLETYQGDIEQMVQNKNVSVLSIATAEAERRASTPSQAGEQTSGLPEAGSSRALLRRAAMVVAGIILIAAAAGALIYIFYKPAPGSAPAEPVPQSPFILVDDTKTVALPQPLARNAAMSNLESAKEGVQLSLGLVARLLPEVASTTASGNILIPLGAQDFLTLLAPGIPPDLLRTVQPAYLLGAHVYDNNQPFLILRVDSYETAYAGTLAWESSMPQDLAPLFNYTPRPRIPEEGVATSSASSTQQFIQTGFVDQIVENHDARVLVNQYGDIYLLWTFLDRNTLVITTNSATLREIISRIQNAPLTPIPGQQE